MSDTLILGIATLTVGLFGTVFTAYMTYRLARLDREHRLAMARIARRQRQAVKKVVQVETTLNETQSAQNTKLDRVEAKVQEVRDTTNGLTAKLMAKTEAEALARGGAEEREREAERKRTEGDRP